MIRLTPPQHCHPRDPQQSLKHGGCQLGDKINELFFSPQLVPQAQTRVEPGPEEPQSLSTLTLKLLQALISKAFYSQLPSVLCSQGNLSLSPPGKPSRDLRDWKG